MEKLFERTASLIGNETFNKIRNKRLVLCGVGGVGCAVLIGLVRSGFSNILIIDDDIVSPSNLNRQTLYDFKDIGEAKVNVAQAKALAVNPDIKIDIKKVKITFDNVKTLIDNGADIVIDCIDDVFAKIGLIKFCNENNIKIISCMGMAKRVNPSLLKIAKLNSATCDPLAKKLRYELKQKGISFSCLDVVYSLETPVKGNDLNSIITVTSSAGLLIVYHVIEHLKLNERVSFNLN